MLKESRQIILWKRLSESIAPFSLKILTHQIQKLVFDRLPKNGLVWYLENLVLHLRWTLKEERSNNYIRNRRSADSTGDCSGLSPWSLVLDPWCYYETTILWINNITRDRQWSWRQTWPPLQNCHLSSKEWLPRKNKELLLSMRSQEAPPSKLLSQLFLKIKGSRCKGDPDFAFVCQSWLSARENVAKESLLTGCIETTWERGEASQRKL